MTKTVEIILFCAVFLAQVLLLSGLYAGRLIRDRRYVLRNYPPATHPRLYPQPIAYYEGKLRNFTRLNRAIMVAGFVIIVGILGALAGLWDGGLLDPAQDSRWSSLIVVPYFIVQSLATFYLDFSIKHNLAMVKAPPPRVRTSELRRRQISDFASPAVLALVALLNAGFVVFALYYRRFGFDWYTAAGNIAGVCFLLLVLMLSLCFALRAPRADPYQRHEDRRDWLRLVVRHVIAMCIAAPVLVTGLLWAKLVGGEGFLAPFLTSLYCLGFGLAMLWPQFQYRVESIDFDVYRSDGAPGPAGVSSTTAPSP